MSEPRKTDTKTLAKALRILSREIQSVDGVANAAIAEAADRLEELRMTPAEQEAVAFFSRFARPHNGPVIGKYAATLRGLLERTGGGR